MANRTRDLFPGMKTAGQTIAVLNESAANCLKTTNNFNPGTPEHHKKYRKSYKNSHGQTILHYGVYDDPKPNEHYAYGIKVQGSDHVKDVLDKGKPTGINEMISEIKEAQYLSRKIEPLGRRAEKNYEFPTEVHQEKFRFGQQPVESEYTAKEVVFPQDPIVNDKEAQARYVWTHGNYEAGEQKQRGYNWKVDPKNHRFGQTQTSVRNEVEFCLKQESLPDQFPKTTIVQKKQEDFRNFKNDHLGLPKNLGQENASKDPNVAFGARLGGPDEWNAGKCINGEGTFKDVKVDPDLGKTNRFGFRNTVKEGDENRVFGVPTIRSDIAKAGLKSIADPTNYGDEKPALNLLFPKKYDFMGVGESDFNALRHKYEIKDIFAKIGYTYKIGKFEGIFRRALEIQGGFEQKCSVASFMQAVQEMHHID